MKKKIYITSKLPSIAQEVLEKAGFQVDTPAVDRPLNSEELVNVIKEYEGILSNFHDKISKDMLKNAEHLQVISNYATGLDNIDVDFARSLGIAVYNTPDLVTHSTADLTLAILLALVRKIPEAKQFVNEGRWKFWQAGMFLGEELLGKTLGIIGFGRIGKEVARRALSFGLHVVYYHYRDISIDKDLQNRVSQVSLQELFSTCDYLTLHVPLTAETTAMIDRNAFAMMKKRPVLINAARGKVVQTDDLITALREGKIRGAALDVTDPEPINPDNPLCRMENCLITPHIGTATKECRDSMADKAAKNIVKHLQGI
jgi:glyoxylate reductase